MRRFLFVLVLLTGLLVVVDRGAVWLAERQLADRVAAELAAYDADAAPTAEIAGFPFLTQLLSGTYEKITVDMGDVQVEDWTLERTTLTARSVDAPLSTLVNGSGTAVAGRLDGVAVVSYDVLESLTGDDSVQLSKGAGRTIDVEADRTIRGTAVTFVGSGTVTVGDGGLRVDVSDVQPGSGLDAELPPVEISFDLPVPPLPYDLELTQARPTADGFEVAFSGHDVSLAG